MQGNGDPRDRASPLAPSEGAAVDAVGRGPVT